MQGDSSTPEPRNQRTEPTRDRGTAERSDAGGSPDEESRRGRIPLTCSQARRPPWLTSFARPPKSLDVSKVSRPSETSDPSSQAKDCRSQRDRTRLLKGGRVLDPLVPFVPLSRGTAEERSDDAGGFLDITTSQLPKPSEGQGDGRAKRCRGITGRRITPRPHPTHVLAGSQTPLAHCVRPSPLKGGRLRRGRDLNPRGGLHPLLA